MTDPLLPLIVEPAELEPHLDSRRVVVVDLAKAPVYAQHHIPGAIPLDVGQILASRPPVMGLLPEPDVLSRVLGTLGITPETHVVAYDEENNTKACRLLWTLDVAGHRAFSLLDGGLPAWQGEGRALSGARSARPASEYPVTYRTAGRADKRYILDRLGDPGVVIVDTRSAAEYAGTDRRAQRAGHIPGAVNVEWSLAAERANHMRLKPPEALRALYTAAGVTPEREVIVHCQTHQRSSHTYVVLKSLGYPRVRGYPGSWSDWGNDPETPIEQDLGRVTGDG